MPDALRWLRACGVVGLALALFAAPAVTADDGDPLDIRVTQRIARHKSIETTTIYTQPSDEDVVRAVRHLPC